MKSMPRLCAQFAPGCKFAPQVQICTPGVFSGQSCERCCKNLHPGANLFAPTLEVVQIVHMNAKCSISIHFVGNFDLWQAFSTTILYKTDIKMNLKLFFIKIKIRLFVMADQTTK